MEIVVAVGYRLLALKMPRATEGQTSATTRHTSENQLNVTSVLKVSNLLLLPVLVNIADISEADWNKCEVVQCKILCLLISKTAHSIPLRDYLLWDALLLLKNQDT